MFTSSVEQKQKQWEPKDFEFWLGRAEFHEKLVWKESLEQSLISSEVEKLGDPFDDVKQKKLEAFPTQESSPTGELVASPLAVRPGQNMDEENYLQSQAKNKRTSTRKRKPIGSYREDGVSLKEQKDDDFVLKDHPQRKRGYKRRANLNRNSQKSESNLQYQDSQQNEEDAY